MIDQLYKFILLFFGTLLVFKVTPRPLKWAVLLVASYWLYMSCDPHYWWLLPIMTAEVYAAAILIEKISSKRTSRLMFATSVCLTLLPLLRFKHIGTLFNDAPHDLRQVILPLGISFYTFQAVSYLYDVFKKRIPANRHFGIVSLYIAFFPHLLAGPLVKADKLFPQLEAPFDRGPEFTDSGWRLIFFGLFKKFAVANHLGVFVVTAFAMPGQFHGFPLLLGAILFRYQLYFDFSGYSDIAIGTARLFGIELPPNFNHPFSSSSVGEHWRRWHMSLVSWFRDHVYLPLCRLIRERWWFAVAGVVTLTLVGLWHNVTWGWFLAGALSGLLLVLDLTTAASRRRFNTWIGLDRVPRFHKAWSVVTTFLILLVPWMAAMSGSPREYLSTLRSAYGVFSRGYFNVEAFRTYFDLYQKPLFFISAICLVMAVEFVHFLMSRKDLPGSFSARWNEKPFVLRYCVYAVATVLFIVFADIDRFDFIYFQF